MRLFTLLFTAGLLLAELPTGNRLPPLKGEFLTGRKGVLPDAAAGKVTLLALGFSYESRFAVESWTKRFRGDFGSNPKIGFYEVPMLGGMAKMGKWFIDSGMRRGTPKEDQEHVMTVYGGVDAWKGRVGFKAPDDAYLILLDQDGAIRWQHSAGVLEASQERAYQGLVTIVSNLLSK